MTTLTSTSDPRIPDRDRCVTRYLLERWASEKPEQVFAVFQDGEEWQYGQLLGRVRQIAGGFAESGVKRGDHVAVWMFDGKEAILTFFALNYLGAVFVPLNTAFKGKVLEHTLNLSDAAVLVAHGQLLDRLAEVDCPKIGRIICLGDEAAPGGLSMFPGRTSMGRARHPPNLTAP